MDAGKLSAFMLAPAWKLWSCLAAFLSPLRERTRYAEKQETQKYLVVLVNHAYTVYVLVDTRNLFRWIALLFRA